MALNFLSLVNDVNTRLNEVPLTSSNFGAASGVYADNKGHINNAINRINREEFEWPFNHVTKTQTLVVNQSRYPYEADAKSVAFDTFRLKRDDTFNMSSRQLGQLDYEEVLHKFPDYEFNPADYADTPTQVYRARNLSFGVVPPPDQAYEVLYEYYKLPTDMVNWDDIPSIPEHFRWVILEGAMYYAYLFRGGLEEAAASNELFKQGIKDMRKIFINRTEYVRSSVIRS